MPPTATVVEIPQNPPYANGHRSGQGGAMGTNQTGFELPQGWVFRIRRGACAPGARKDMGAHTRQHQQRGLYVGKAALDLTIYRGCWLSMMAAA